MRKHPLETGEIYHVMNKSIAGFKIFNSDDDYKRMINTLRYFSVADSLPKFSYFLKRSQESGKYFTTYFDQCFGSSPKTIQWIAYCLMPTHIHFIFKQLKKTGISNTMADTLNSYTRFFNIKHKRKGPLWVGRFKSVLIESDEQLQHLTRYVHLNPTTAKLTKKSENWDYSSYREYITPRSVKPRLCQYRDLLDFKPADYRKFVEDQADYQRELAQIKHLTLE